MSLKPFRLPEAERFIKIPKEDAHILGCSSEHRSFGVEGDGNYGLAMPFEGKQSFSLWIVPEVYHTIASSSGKHFPVFTETDLHDLIFMG